MSVEAISWALNLARSRPTEAATRLARASSCSSAWPTTPGRTARARSRRWPRWSATPACRSGRYARLDRLQAECIISPCDPDIVAARIKRADRRPQGWDLNLSLVRGDLDDAAVAVLEHQFPALGIRLAAAPQPGADGQTDGVPGTGRSGARAAWVRSGP